MEGHHLQQQYHHHHPLQQQRSISVNVVDAADRFPQWSVQETKEFLMIRAELDQSFMETKRNKILWEVISTKMKDRGFHRSAEQCKCKWKNLVTRYKGCETMEEEGMRQQFPFYNEMQSIFTARMHRMLWVEAEGGASSSKRKASPALLSSDEEEDVTEFSEGDKSVGGSRKKKVKGQQNTAGTDKSGVMKLLQEFMHQQLQIELQWRESVELRENERRVREMEWRQKMESLETERMMMDQRCREREEQRRIREEARAEKRDALITALLNKLRREENS